MKKETGGPAFPAMNDNGYWVGGMTLRDYFAAKAMEGKLSAGATGYDDIALHAYKYADAMLKAREA
jgi:hypothetical protein